MVLDKFKELDILAQATIICQFGLPVAELEDEHFNYMLYQYSDFYVEVKYLKTGYLFYSLHAFSAKSCYLDLYLNKIDIAASIIK